MKPIQRVTFSILFFSVCIIIFSCGDSAVVNINNPGSTSFTNLKPLNQSTEGLYEAWISFEEGDHGDESYISLGRFNISNTGAIVDSNGSAYTLKFKTTPANINLASDALVTIERPGDNDTLPNGVKLMGGIKTVTTNELVFDVSMAYNEILGTIAQKFLTDSAKFIFATPSTTDTTDEYKGIWFTNAAGIEKYISCLPVADSLDWIYEAFLISESDTSKYWSFGKFSDPNLGDLDGAGPYKGTTGIEWDKPGQDYINTNPLPSPFLNTGIYRLIISLVPKSGYLSPYYIVLFSKHLETLPYHTAGMLDNTAKLPAGQIHLAK